MADALEIEVGNRDRIFITTEMIESLGFSTGAVVIPNPLSLPFTSNLGTPTPLILGNVDVGTWLEIQATDPGAYSNFYGTWASTPNFIGPNDDVVILGHNTNLGGGQVDGAKSAVGISWESNFIAGHPQTEFHLFSWPPNTVPLPVYKQNRFLSHEGHNDDGSTSLFIYSIDISLGSGWNASDPPSLSITPTATNINSPLTTLSPILQDIAYASLTLDGSGGTGTATLGVAGAAHVTTAQLVMADNGSLHMDSSLVGRLLDLRNNGGNNPSFQWDNGSSQIFSPDNQTHIDVTDGAMLFTAGNVFNVFGLSAGGGAFNQRPLNLLLANVGTNTRGDQIESLLIRNDTAATPGALQYSPSIVLTGFGTNGGANQSSSFQMQNQTDINGGGSFTFSFSTDQANFFPKASISSAGALSLLDSFGLFGVTPPPQQTLPANPTTAQIRAVLVAFGQVTP